MTRAFAFLFAAVVALAGAGHAQAQGFPNFFDDSRDIMGGGPGFFRPGMPLKELTQYDTVMRLLAEGAL